MPDDPTFPKEPTLFAEASLVSHSPKRESSKLKTTPDISGRKCLELSGNSGPLGCVEKMLLDSCDWAWTKYSLTWKAKATPRGRLIFQLARQAHPTSDNDYGLLHTPTAKANQMAPSMATRDNGSWGLSLGGAKPHHMIPTPTTMDHIERKNTNKTPSTGKLNYETNKSVSLDRWVKMWPTPRATSRMAYHESPTKSQIKGTHGWNLNAAVTDSLADDPARLWPTPNVQDLNKTTGHLNPKWVAWLMGYPIEYLSCVPWGTQSSRKSRKE